MNACEGAGFSNREYTVADRMSSNSPSGGMKLIVRVASKSFNRTH